MRIISWNVNGIRAVYKKDFLKWFKKSGVQMLCLQELKAQEKQIPLEPADLKGFEAFFNLAKKPGYSGVAVFTKIKPLAVKRRLGLERFDSEGRLLRLDFPDFTLINLYMPHGGRDKSNLEYKLEAYKFLFSHLRKIKSKKIILMGDFNIAHTELDLARPRQNQNNIMYTLEERKQIDSIREFGFTDTFRNLHPGQTGQYTWWPYFANARARNLGWRIDYCFTSGSLAAKVKKAFILPKVLGSDHCPIGIEAEI